MISLWYISSLANRFGAVAGFFDKIADKTADIILVGGRLYDYFHDTSTYFSYAKQDVLNLNSWIDDITSDVADMVSRVDVGSIIEDIIATSTTVYNSLTTKLISSFPILMETTSSIVLSAVGVSKNAVRDALDLAYLSNGALNTKLISSFPILVETSSGIISDAVNEAGSRFNLNNISSFYDGIDNWFDVRLDNAKNNIVDYVADKSEYILDRVFA